MSRALACVWPHHKVCHRVGPHCLRGGQLTGGCVRYDVYVYLRLSVFQARVLLRPWEA